MNSFLNLLFPLRAILSGNANELITLAFILTILIYAVYCVIHFLTKTRRQGALLRSLTEDVRRFQRPAASRVKHELEQLFQAQQELGEVWREFEDSLVSRPREDSEIVYKTEESGLYFSEERLIGQYMNVRYWNTVPSLLVGLGILGTFVGLTFGLVPFSTINFTETSEIQRAIQELLSGVSIAFTTSVWGMLTSILFNWLEKRRIGQLSTEVAGLQRALDQLFTLTTQEEIEYKQQDELEQQTQALKSFSTDLADHIKVAMDGVVTQQQSNLQGELQAIQERNETHAQELIEEVHQLGDRIEGSMRGMVTDQLAPVLANVRHAVDELRAHKEESSTEAIQLLVSEFQQSLASTTLSHLETLAQTIQDVNGQLVTLPDQMSTMMGQVQSQVHESRDLLELVAGRMETDSERRMREFDHTFGKLTTAFEHAIEQHHTGLTQTSAQVSEQMAKTAQQLGVTLGKASQQLGEYLGMQLTGLREASDSFQGSFANSALEHRQAVADIMTHVMEQASAASSLMKREMESISMHTEEHVQRQVASVERVLESLTGVFNTAVARQTQAIKQLVSHVAQESNATTAAMQEQVQGAAGVFAQNIDTLRQQVESLLEQQKVQTQEANALVGNSQKILSKGRSLMQEMQMSAESVKEMLGNVHSFTEQLNTGADRMDQVSQSLLSATQTFSEQNEAFSNSNQETLQRVEGSLDHAQNLLGEFSSKFQVIEGGLTNIFGEVQQGLTAYAVSTRESINQYLSEFSQQLVQASNALAGSIEALEENIDELNESLEKRTGGVEPDESHEDEL